MKRKISLYISLGSFASFLLWTLLVSLVDVRGVGPNESNVGFATFNKLVHSVTGVHMALYTITDWLGLVPIIFALGFAVLGLVQLIKRKSLLKVDKSVIALGIFYLAVMVAYLTFEKIIINYRPVLIEGHLEVSYPSSTTLLVLCVMTTSIMQFNNRIKNRILRRIVNAIIILFMMFMVLARLFSGVHWATDIIGGVFLSSGLVTLYYYVIKKNAIAFK